MKRILPLLALFAITLVPAATLDPKLLDRMAEAGPDGLIPVVVLMDSFPDQEELLTRVRVMDRTQRRAHVLDTMKRLAERSQGPLLQALDREQQGVGRIQVLWSINGVALHATPDVIHRIAGIPGIRSIRPEHTGGRPAELHLDSTIHGGTATGGGGISTNGAGPTGGDTSGPNPDATVRGEITDMGAEQVWNDLGYTGAGVIVAVNDTGTDWTHPDLADHIWTNLDEIPGNGLDDDGNGYVDDTLGWDFCHDDPVPELNSHHGTQVSGQIAGDGTDGVVTGMAPDAEIMILDFGDCGPTGAPDTEAFRASQYALDNGADILNMSFAWVWNDTEHPDLEAWRRMADTELAAGMLRVNAAGNEGDDRVTSPLPYNVTTPANCPPPWLHPDQTPIGGTSSTLAVGNIGYSSDLIMSHSSRGPSAWEDVTIHTDPDYPHTLTAPFMDYPYENGVEPGLIKPDLSAYGNGTSSTCVGGSYCSFSGTSSASPKVAGAAALMLQANPWATPEELAEALMTSAEHRGTPGKNNDYGTGLLQAFAAVELVEAGVLYDSHSIDDTTGGNGDLDIDPGETVSMQITVRSVDDLDINGLELIVTSETPGVTIHNHHITFPTVTARGLASNLAPDLSFTLAPDLCAEQFVLRMEMRYDGNIRRSAIEVRVGEEIQLAALSDDFETDTGWTSDPGTASQGQFVREDPIGVTGSVGGLSCPEDDTSNPGTMAWVTGNGELSGKKGEDNNDVDDGEVILLSPPFGSPNYLSMNLTYDRWYYDIQSGGNNMYVEVSNNGGTDWVLLEQLFVSTGGWGSNEVDLFALMPITDDMRLRFRVSDLGDPGPVEGAVDEVHIDGLFVDCQTFTPGSALPPNPVGDTLSVDASGSGHTVLSWSAPPVDGSHDAATLYRIQRSVTPAGPFTEAGSSTLTSWLDVDATVSVEPYYYRVIAENAGGTE